MYTGGSFFNNDVVDRLVSKLFIYKLQGKKLNVFQDVKRLEHKYIDIKGQCVYEIRFYLHIFISI